MVALLDALVDIWKVCAEAGYGFQDSGSVQYYGFKRFLVTRV